MPSLSNIFLNRNMFVYLVVFPRAVDDVGFIFIQLDYFLPFPSHKVVTSWGVMFLMLRYFFIKFEQKSLQQNESELHNFESCAIGTEYSSWRHLLLFTLETHILEFLTGSNIGEKLLMN